MKLALFGSRSINDDIFVRTHLEAYLSVHGTVTSVLMGGASGVQDIAKDYLKDKVDVVTFKPWHMVDTKMHFVTKYFFMRNKQIIDNSNRVLVFLKEGEEDGEVDKTIEFAHQTGKQVDIVRYPAVVSA